MGEVQMKMVRQMNGNIVRDRIRNKRIHKKLEVALTENKMRKN